MMTLLVLGQLQYHYLFKSSLMKAIILIISVIISIIGLIAGQFLYPLIASWFDTYPWIVALIGVGILFIFITLFTWVLTKNNWIRSFILIPVFVFSLATVGILYIRFEGDHYENGYCYTWGCLKNRFGITIIDSDYSAMLWYKGISKFGEEVFVNVGYYNDWEYPNEIDYNRTKQGYQIIVYDKSGNFIDDKSFSLYYEKNEEKFFFNIYDLDPKTRHFIETYTDITVYQKIG